MQTDPITRSSPPKPRAKQPQTPTHVVPDPTTWPAWEAANPLLAPGAPHYVTTTEAAMILGDEIGSRTSLARLIEERRLLAVHYDGLVLVSLDHVEKLNKHS